MMSELNVQLCPETGICSIIKADGRKIDLMPDEVSSIRDAGEDQVAVKNVLTEIDCSFSDGLDPAEVEALAKRLKR